MKAHLHEKEKHVTDLEELFTKIAKYRLKLNPEKCVFGVKAGKFLGFLLTERGIEANPEKYAAIKAMKNPISMKEVQQLIGAWPLCPDSYRQEETRGTLTSSA